MANIRVDLDYTIKDGSSVVFRSPCDCTQITGLIVYYKSEEGTQTSCTFSLADAHGENVGDIPHLFAENVVVKVILDITNGMAFVQNADTNSYLEAHINNERNPHNVTAEQVGARPNTWMPTAQDVGALPNTYTPPNQTAAQVGADPAGTAESKVSTHNTATDSHNDIRLELQAINAKLTAFFDSDNQTLDELSEIVAYITSNKALIDAITTSKVSVSDIIDNLTTNVSNKPLSAAQGVALKALIDAITVPTKLSQLAGDSTHRTVTDAEKTSWNAVGDKLNASELHTAINTALAQAKASGAFDGTSVTVKSVSESTEDGGSNVVTFSDGKNVTIKNGKQGSPGKTPVKGTDYWSAADQEAIVQQVISALGTPVFGTVDADKNIITTGDLADGTYTYWYEGKDGKLVGIGTLTIGESRPIGVNLIPLSINADGTPYVGTNGEDGYKTGYRLNSAGEEVAFEGMHTTGFMPIETGDTISVDKMCWTANHGTYNYRSYINLYNESFELVGSAAADKFKASAPAIDGVVSGGVFVAYDAGDGQANYNHLKRFKIDAVGAKYMRMCSYLISASSVVMINES